MITEVNFIGITPFDPKKDLLIKVKKFFEGSKKALIIRLNQSTYSESLIEEIENLSKRNQSIIIFNSRNKMNNHSNIHLTSKDLMNSQKRFNGDFILGAS